jgi:hypothetical protein
VDFLECRSVGLDEARLAVNIAARSPLQLFRPLDLDQTAPPLFLLGERLLFLLSGYSDCSLRLLPVLAGTAAALLVYPLARRFLSDVEARLAAVVAVFCPLLLTYSNAVKQYSVELLAAVLILLLLERAGRRDDLGNGAVGLLVAGVVAPWISLTSAFVLAAGWIVFAVLAFRGRRGAARLALAAGAAWGVSGAVAYATVYAAAARSPYLGRFWELAFVTPGRPGFPAHAWKTLEDQVWGFVAGDPLVDRRPFLLLLHIGTALVLLLIALGASRVKRTRGWTASWWLWGPVALTVAASMLHVFPLAPRLTLFLLPGLIILFIAGLREALGRIGETAAARRLVLVTVLLALALEFQSVVRAFAAEPSADFKPLVRTLRERWRQGEPVYVFARSLPAWIFYSTDWARPDTARVRFLAAAASSRGGAFENAPRSGRPRGPGVVFRSPAETGFDELLGLPSGMEWREVEEHVGVEPDRGWVETESRRIEGAAAPGIWVVATTWYAPEAELFRALDRRARGRTLAYGRAGTLLVRYEFAGPGRAGAGEGAERQSHSSAAFGRRRTSPSAGR